MAIKARGETIDVKDQVNLTVQFKDNNGIPTNTDIFPNISIVQPSGLVLLSPTSAGVAQVGTGKYSYLLDIPLTGPWGVYNDIWSGLIGGEYIEETFSFVVTHTDIPSINSDGYIHLGDDPGFHYSQTATFNINKLIKMLKARLNSSGKVQRKDSFGNTVYISCDIFSIEMLVNFLAMSLSYFNSIPHFTFFTFDDSGFVDQFGEILVIGAEIWALSSMALLHRGSEFNITEGGINFTVPTVSELLNTQYSTELTFYAEQVKYIKNSLRSFPLSLGVISMNSGGLNPAVKNLRLLRARRLF